MLLSPIYIIMMLLSLMHVIMMLLSQIHVIITNKYYFDVISTVYLAAILHKPWPLSEEQQSKINDVK